MYTLISAPVLGYDLTRLPGGTATAETMAAVLAVPESALAGLEAVAARQAEPAGRAACRAAVRAAAMARAATRPSVRELSGRRPETAVALLERTPIGSLPDLLHCVRNDLLPTPGALVDAVADAVTACYLRELLTATERQVLAAPWLALRRHLPPDPPELGPQRVTLGQLLHDVRTLDRAGLRALIATTERRRGADPGDWAQAVHAATWAVHLTGRERAAAAAQLLLVQAVDLGRVPVAQRATGVWNLLSGAVHGLVVRDVADAATTYELLTPCVEALGPGWLTVG